MKAIRVNDLHRRKSARGLSHKIVGLTLTLTLTSCSHARQGYSNAAPPTVVCGTVLNNTAEGAVVIDASEYHGIVRHVSVHNFLYIQVSDDCSQGARVTWTPPQAAVMVKEALAKDGLLAAIVLRPATPSASFVLSAERSARIIATLQVSLSP